MSGLTGFAGRPCRYFLAGALVLIFFLVTTPSAAASDLTPADSGPMLVLFADSLKKYLTGGGRRGRIVQICVICMAVALFIMMKKFSAKDDG